MNLSQNQLKGKKILLGVTGSIAAYKIAILIRLFVKAGASVQVVMTKAATNFITPLTLSTLSKHSVFTEVSSDESWNNHVELGLWADAMVIAPLTATTLAKMTIGLCDNMVVATYLSAKCPVFFAPAMDLDMWKHPATQNNVRQLQSYGNHLIPVEFGELASGLVGAGRMAAPENIVRHLNQFFTPPIPRNLVGKKVVVTAGPTYEPIDPVRFIGNRSSGKMGIAIAETFAKHGAKVFLVLGPSQLKAEHQNIQMTRVQTAEQMYDITTRYFEKSDIAIMAAAVADYRPKFVAKEKIKKKTTQLSIELEKTPDIAAMLGSRKQPHQLLIGFALETQNEIANATKKLHKKNFDFIVLNSLRDKGAGFHHDTNKVTIIDKFEQIDTFELKSKTAVAADIVNKVVDMLTLGSER